MKKVITAIGNNILNKKLKQNENIMVVGEDIPYKEGVLEVLKEYTDIDCLILSQLLDGEIQFNILIEEILKIKRNIEIIVFVEKEDLRIRSFLYNKGIYKIYTNNELEIEEFERIILDGVNENTEALAEEIKKLKKIIEEQRINMGDKNKNGKITAITGVYGSRKEYINMRNLQRV